MFLNNAAQLWQVTDWMVENLTFPHLSRHSQRLMKLEVSLLCLKDPAFSNILIYVYLRRCNVTRFILSGNCSTCFGWYYHPSSRAQTTVSTASGICHTVTAICRYRGRDGTGLSVLWVQIAVTVWQMPDAVDTVVCAPDDGWWYHPKRVEQFPVKMNYVTLRLFGYLLEYFYDARTHEL